MLKIYCPYCEAKLEEEDFSYAGEAFIQRPQDPESLSDEKWGDYLFMRQNPKGKHWEQWNHSVGCRKFFVVQRSTIDNTIFGSFTMKDARQQLSADGAEDETN